jgi:hypothetical protein
MYGFGKGWRTATGAVENQDLWKKLAALMAVRSIEWQWVKGHNGHVQKERANTMAIAAATHQTSRDDVPALEPAVGVRPSPRRRSPPRSAGPYRPPRSPRHSLCCAGPQPDARRAWPPSTGGRFCSAIDGARQFPKPRRRRSPGPVRGRRDLAAEW